MTRKTLEERRLDYLYKLLEETRKKGDVDTADALHWAIFELEKLYGVGIN